MPTDTEFPSATQRYDPYRSFKFRVKWDGRYVAGISKVSALKRTPEVIKHRSGGDASAPRSMPAQSQYEPITLERGVTYDVAFEQWANKVWDYNNFTSAENSSSGNQAASLNDFRKDITLELYNEAGQKVMAYNIYRCWPSEFLALPELDANGNAAVIQSLKLENEGWDRDPSVEEPAEPSFTEP